MKRYYEKYTLLVDLPSGQEKGTIFYKRCNQDGVLYWTESNGYGGDSSKSPKFNVEQMGQKKFFAPIGEPKDLILPFPSREDLKEYFSLLGEARCVNSVDLVRLINPIFDSDEFENAVYELLKKMYNEEYFSKP